MKVRAKFRVSSIERSKRGWGDNAEIQTVKMSPVTSDGDGAENTKFWEATPSGKLELGCINADAAAYFDLDGEYYVDFTKAPDGE